MNQMQEDAIVEKYEDIILLGVGLPAIALVFFAYKYFGAMIDDFMLATAGTATAIALAVFIVVGIASYRRYHRFPWVKKYFTTLLYSLFFFPLFGITVVMGTNCYFDNSAPVERNTAIVDKHESHSYRKGRRRDYYNVFVRSWRPDMDRIQIRVGSGEFAQFGTGDMVTVRTKRGYWGLEWLCGSE